MQSPITLFLDQTQQEKKIHDQTYTKVVYEIKLSSMRSQIKSPIKNQFYFDTMLKTKKDSKREKKKDFLLLILLEKGTTSLKFK